MIHPYINKAEETYKKATNNIDHYKTNEIYLNTKYNLYFYINQKGFLHILEIKKIKDKDKYIITDSFLTKDNMLREKATNTYNNDYVMELLENVIKI